MLDSRDWIPEGGFICLDSLGLTPEGGIRWCLQKKHLD